MNVFLESYLKPSFKLFLLTKFFKNFSVAVSRSKEVPVFGPPIHQGATFPKGKAFSDFLLAKVINAEIAAHRSEKFSTMATRTRQEYLKDLATNYVTSTLVESSQKFCKYIFFKTSF